ncbi:hypothetical protein SASPL_151463 [Salvia splendens]|uniref:Phorbol-ester/DAG-type domain-containing protein n=1 Tax=Salvia splendens TaxID=180675 RepID=A0A8X8Z3R0_SALSN|nr:hypothetical protein SASPL_151463 [Salvia splendens]
MRVGRDMMVSSSPANNVIFGFIKTAPYCLLLSSSSLILGLSFSYILFLPVPGTVSALAATNPCFIPITPSIYVPKPWTFLMSDVDLTKFNQVQTSLKLIQLPDDELDTFPNLEIRTYSQADGEEPSDEDRKLVIENFHKHPLVLVGDDEEEDRNYNYKRLVCDICTQTITIPSPFYRCSQQTGGCSFLAHKVCSELLPIIKFEIPTGYNSLKTQPFLDPEKWYFSSIFLCVFCCLPTNAPCYYIREDDLGLLVVDLSCMATPMIIKHSSHSQHILFRTTRLSPQASPMTCCSRRSTLHDVYKCTTCHFYIHIRCALLPKRVHFRKFDQHPLHLITTATINTGSDHDICEVCEEGIECKYWFYHCAICDYSFHVNCIPSLGHLSKVKFGGKSSLTCHSHPLTLTRMLTYGRNERCGYCHQIIPGLVDQPAFSCSQCDYWIHFSCARDSFTSSHNSTSLVFEEIDAQKWFMIIETAGLTLQRGYDHRK